jgi:hypothetical protein
MRLLLNEVSGLRARATQDAEEISGRRADLRETLLKTEHAARLTARDPELNGLGERLAAKLHARFGEHDRGRVPSILPPATLATAKRDINRLAAETELDTQELLTALGVWQQRTFKTARSRPVVPDELWARVHQLDVIEQTLPELREQFVAEAVASKEYLRHELAADIERRRAAADEHVRRVRELLVDARSGLPTSGSTWDDPAWANPTATGESSGAIRIGDFEPRLPGSHDVGTVPALLSFPFASGVAIDATIDNRRQALALAGAVVLRLLAAVPAGDLRFTFVDPVSLGQSVAEFRHLHEFDPRLVGEKTWTSSRDIEARLQELSDHLEVVISTYLRGQFSSIDEYNAHAGEVAEPYRVLVVFDYPEGFTEASSRHLLSLIENGPKCGVHTILIHGGAVPDHSAIVPIERLEHSMQRVRLSGGRGRVELPAPIGAVDLDFLPDACPPVSFSPGGDPLTPAAELLVRIGTGARASETDPVTLDRVLPILDRIIASGRSREAPVFDAPGVSIEAASPSTWWQGRTATGAFAPIGRSGAQDLAAFYLSSTDIAGGAIMVGLPRSGKTTALHAAITSLALLYPPEELELYLIDAKHGVEFKVYEDLPHARLVSVHSDREFSTAVLQSLAAEIARRANVMKRETAGKANITEYRSATGETMSRIVLFIDEFHELFEEDDALGQAAFRAFSDIVRMGPFAGVHVIVSSQALSSMPAMDRGTLGLLPIRVAFTCNDTDADFVMGDDNREVRALSRQGEGILNPARGSTAHNRPFRGLYVRPAERKELLRALRTKADASGFHRQARSFDGDRYAERTPDAPRGTPTRPFVPLGEPFSLEPAAGISLARGRGSNIVIVGSTDRDDRPDTAVEGAIHSVLASGAQDSLDLRVVDFAGAPAAAADALDLWSLCTALGVPYGRSSDLDDALAEVEAEIGRRREGRDYGAPARMTVLVGLERALDLVPADPYADPDDAAQGVPARLAAVLRDGPDVGCHTVVAVDGLAQLDRRLGRELLKEFEWRVAGSGLSQADRQAITDSYTEREISHGQLLLADHARGRSRRVRGYPPLTTATTPATTDRSDP